MKEKEKKGKKKSSGEDKGKWFRPPILQTRHKHTFKRQM